MQKTCISCGRERSTKYMQQAVFRDPYWPARDERVDVWKCASTQSCKKAREVCKRCGHLKRLHIVHKKWFNNRENVKACSFNMGMGDPCGCGENDGNISQDTNTVQA